MTTIDYYAYQWLRNGSAISGATSSTYLSVTADIGTGSLTADVWACSNVDGCGGPAVSNAVTVTAPVNNPPYTPSLDVFPPTGSYTNGQASSPFYMKYSDPDGDSGYITYSIFNASGVLQQSGSGATVPSGGDSIWYANSLVDGAYHWTAVATDSHGANSGTSAAQYFTVDKDPPATSGVTPATGSTVPTVSPTLTVSPGIDPEGETVGYDFSVYQGATCTGSAVVTSSWITSTAWQVPSNVLLDTTQYAWCVQTRDFVTKVVYSWPISPAFTFTVGLPKLGSEPYWPMWHGGALQVNESTGNLVLGVPGPSFQTAAGRLGASFVYNLLDQRASVFSSGTGAWTFADASGAPAKLIDHSGLGGAGQQMDSVERVEADGSSRFYGHIAGTDRYSSPAGDLSVLTMIGIGGSRTFQLDDPNGSSFQFGTPDSNGVAALAGAQIVSANGQAQLVYSFTSTKLTLIQAQGKDSGGAFQTYASLALNWSCGGALVCITGPDGRVWQYVGTTAGGTTGDLASVFDGTRTVMQITYDTITGRPIEVQNADDLDPVDASPGYLTNHSVAVAYTGLGATSQTSTISDTNVRASASNSTPTTRITGFDYTASGVCPSSTQHFPLASHPQFTALTLRGCTKVTSPNQHGGSLVARVFFDNLGHPLEIDSPLETVSTNKNFELYAYDGFNTLEWSETGDGYAADNTYSTDAYHTLTQTQAPDPLISGLGRPTTSYRYDEAAAGATPTTPGTPLAGLQARYYSTNNLSGYPAGTENDAAIDSSTWTAGQPPLLGGQTTNFSIRWTGQITVPTSGAYLATVADGGTRVTIDGDSAVIDHWTGQVTTSPACSPTPVSAGPHQIVVEYNETTNPSSVKLEWNAASCTLGSLTTVPTASFQPEWFNQTSTVSPADSVGGTAILSFSHYLHPETHNPDYSLATAGSNLITNYTYDSYGRPTGKVMPDGNLTATITSGTLSGAGDPTTSSYGTTYSYYPPGNTGSAAAAPPAACGTGFATVGQLGLLKSEIPHGVTGTTYVYNTAGRPLATTKAAGTTCATYDLEGNEVQAVAPNDPTPTSYCYDPNGQLLGTANANGQIINSYDESGAAFDAVDATGAEAATTQDLDGNVLSRSLSVGGALNLSGNEISDISRCVRLRGDGRSVNDSSMGIWQATTNLAANSGPFTNTNTIGSFNSTIAYDNNDTVKFGNALKVTPTSATAATTSASWGAATGSVSGATAGRVYTCSLWLYVPTALVGKTFTVYCRELGGAMGFADTTKTYVVVAGWQRLSVSRTIVQNDRNNVQSLVSASLSTANGPYWAAAAQIEQLPVVTPYVPTANSGSSTGTRNAALVQGNASVLSAAQGWFAVRTRAEWSSTTPPGGGSSWEWLFDWRTDSANRYSLFWDEAGHHFSFVRRVSNNSITANAATQTINPGDTHTIIAKWLDATNIAISVDGGAFVTTAVTGSYTPSLTSFAIGNNTPGTNPFDGEILWSASGTGTLSNTDAATINSYGDTDPTLAGLTVGTPTMVWPANSAAYQTTTTSYSTTNTYDAAEQLSTEADPAGKSYSFYYDNRGNLRGTQYPNGTGGINTYSWTDTNPDGWTLDTSNGHGNLTSTTTSAPADASPIANYNYTYAPDGKKLTEQLSGPSSQTTTYTYDPIGRLLTYAIGGGSSARYCYDADSNRLQVTATSGTACGTATYTYNPANSNSPGVDQLTSVGSTLYQYNNDGQLDCRGTTVTSCPGTSDSFRWDGWGRTSSATVASKSVCYRYDPAGSLLTRIYDSTGTSACSTATSTTNYLLGDLIETNAAGTITSSYQDGPAGNLASYNGAPVSGSTATYLYYSGHGDLAAEANNVGTRTAAHNNDPFGAPLDTPPANATSHRYTGQWNKQYDSTSNLILMGARPYDPTTGRFVALDSADGGSFNSYDYAAQDPINGYDLSGARPTGVVWRSDPTGSWGNTTTKFLVGDDILPPKAYDAGHDYSSNPAVGSTPYDVRFNHPSYIHDNCYGSEISDKKTCDDAFHQNLDESCEGAQPWAIGEALCDSFAYEWYSAVRVCGSGCLFIKNHFNTRPRVVK